LLGPKFGNLDPDHLRLRRERDVALHLHELDVAPIVGTIEHPAGEIQRPPEVAAQKLGIGLLALRSLRNRRQGLFHLRNRLIDQSLPAGDDPVLRPRRQALRSPAAGDLLDFTPLLRCAHAFQPSPAALNCRARVLGCCGAPGGRPPALP